MSDSGIDALRYRWLETPLGPLVITVSNSKPSKLLAVEFRAFSAELQNTAKDELLDLVEAELKAYFAGEATDFTRIFPYLSASGTEFQRKVWQQLLQISYGQTCSYGDIADSIQSPKAVRAVGAANGKNPIAIIVPCHRVIGKNGSLTGYAGGLDKKQWLLNWENQHAEFSLTGC